MDSHSAYPLHISTLNSLRNWMWLHEMWLSAFIVSEFNFTCTDNVSLNVYNQVLNVFWNYLATPFWSMMFPEWRWLQGGKPRSFRNTRASNIWRPNRCTWETGKPALRCPYFWLQSSCHRLCASNKLSQKNLRNFRHFIVHKLATNKDGGYGKALSDTSVIFIETKDI